MIKAVIFDLGGTLIEYAGPYERWPDMETPGFRAAHAFLAGQGVAGLDFERFRAIGFAHLPGRWQQATSGRRSLTVTSLLDEVLQEIGIALPDPALLAEAAAHYQAAIQAQATLMPAAPEIVARLKAAGYRLGLISNTMFTGQAHREDMARFGLDGYFDAMLFSADANKWKPNPAPFAQVLAELGTEAAAAVFVGDDPANDVVGGQRAGLRTIHYRSSDRFAIPPGVQADAEIRHLTELPEVILGLDGDG